MADYEVTAGIRHHTKDQCDGLPCPFHGPSLHPMIEEPMHRDQGQARPRRHWLQGGPCDGAEWTLLRTPEDPSCTTCYPPRLACPICGGDVCEHRIQALESRSALLGAIYDVIWHYRPVTISIRGTHVNWTELATGEFAFNIDNQDHQTAFIEWARALRGRTANAPKPEPPEEYRNG